MATTQDNRFIGRGWLESLGYRDTACPMAAKIEEWRIWYEASGDYWDGTDTETGFFRNQRLTYNTCDERGRASCSRRQRQRRQVDCQESGALK